MSMKMSPAKSNAVAKMMTQAAQQDRTAMAVSCAELNKQFPEWKWVVSRTQTPDGKPVGRWAIKSRPHE